MAVDAGRLLAEGRAVWVPDFVNVTTPAAAANASVPVGRELLTRCVAAMCTFTPDANVASRLISLDFLAGTRTFHRNAAHTLLTATDPATVFVWGRNRHSAQWNTGTPIFVPLLDAPLPVGTSIRFTADSIQATDAFTVLSLWLERLLPTD